MATKRPLCNYSGVITEKSDSDSISGLVVGTDVQAHDGDLDAIAALAGTSGLLKKTAADTWTLDTAAYSTTTGTVTTASVVSVNGFAGTVANASTTPAITLTTSISGMLKGNGTAISAASAGADYIAPPSGTSILKANSGGALANAVAGTDYLAPSAIGVTLQAYDGDLDAIAALAGTSGLLKKTAANTWTLDTAAYSTTTGTVTTASVVSANGFAGTVANASTTPAITLTTSISGMLKGNGTAISAAAAGTDYLAPAAIGSTVQAYSANLTTWAGKTAPSGTVVGTTDTQTLSGKTLGSTKESVYTITDGAAFEIDPANGGIQKITLGAGRTPKGTNFVSGQSVRLKIAATSYTITWTDGTLNPTWLSASDAAGSVPPLSASRTTIVDLWKDADGLYAAHVGYA